jgi:hypothetical protein
MPIESQRQGVPVNHTHDFPPSYEPIYSSSAPAGQIVTPAVGDMVNLDHIWRGFETTANEQLPVWLSDQSLGGNSFQQNGMDAFLLPSDYLPPAPLSW